MFLSYLISFHFNNDKRKISEEMSSKNENHKIEISIYSQEKIDIEYICYQTIII